MFTPGHFAWLPMPTVMDGYRMDRELRLRENYQLAQLEATIRNALGGKGDGTAEPVDESKTFSPAELLNPYARPDWMSQPDAAPEAQPYPVSTAVARGVIEAVEQGLITGELWLELAPVYRRLSATAEQRWTASRSLV